MYLVYKPTKSIDYSINLKIELSQYKKLRYYYISKFDNLILFNNFIIIKYLKNYIYNKL